MKISRQWRVGAWGAMSAAALMLVAITLRAAGSAPSSVPVNLAGASIIDLPPVRPNDDLLAQRSHRIRSPPGVVRSDTRGLLLCLQ